MSRLRLADRPTDRPCVFLHSFSQLCPMYFLAATTSLALHCEHCIAKTSFEEVQYGNGKLHSNLKTECDVRDFERSMQSSQALMQRLFMVITTHPLFLKTFATSNLQGLENGFC